MRIGELARAGGVNPKTIRYYESIGLLREPDRTASGYRDYEPSDLVRLTFIRSAKRLGISLDEIREILAFQQRGEAPCCYVRGVLDAQLHTIDRKIDELRRLRSELSELSAEAGRLPDSTPGSSCRLIEHAGHTVGAA